MNQKKEEKLLQILFEIFVENLIQDRNLINSQGCFNHDRLEALRKKMEIPNLHPLYASISLSCARISETEIPRNISPEVEKSVWLAAVKMVIKSNLDAGLASYKRNAKDLRAEIKARGLSVSEKEFNNFIRPIYLEAVNEIIA
jgi:hypothetical protein